jgi:hypothetical protein
VVHGVRRLNVARLPSPPSNRGQLQRSAILY